MVRYRRIKEGKWVVTRARECRLATNRFIAPNRAAASMNRLAKGRIAQMTAAEFLGMTFSL